MDMVGYMSQGIRTARLMIGDKSQGIRTAVLIVGDITHSRVDDWRQVSGNAHGVHGGIILVTTK